MQKCSSTWSQVAWDISNTPCSDMCLNCLQQFILHAVDNFCLQALRRFSRCSVSLWSGSPRSLSASLRRGHQSHWNRDKLHLAIKHHQTMKPSKHHDKPRLVWTGVLQMSCWRSLWTSPKTRSVKNVCKHCRVGWHGLEPTSSRESWRGMWRPWCVRVPFDQEHLSNSDGPKSQEHPKHSKTTYVF